MTTSEISITIHSGKNSEQVIKFIDLQNFAESFQQHYNSGNIFGCYYDENGNIVAQDIWGEVQADIF